MGSEDVGTMAVKTKVVKSKSKDKKTSWGSLNAFAGQTTPPTLKAVESALGDSHTLWKQLVSELKQDLKLDGEDWHSSGAKYGWAFRLQIKKRNIVYLSPRAGSFVATFILGDKAIAVVRKSNLPAELLQTIAKTKRYGEGTPVWIPVKSPKDLDIVKTIAKIKVEN
jgi:uncharacterized protein DUF3788